MYLGCQTNIGKLVGIKEDILFIQLADGQIIETQDLINTKLILRRIDKLTIEESAELIKHGFSIGRPKGYNFSPEACLYCISKHIDLFGLIEKGIAIEAT